MNVNIKKLKKNATIPTKGSQYCAGYDLYSCLLEPVKIEAGKTAKIPTGLAMEIPQGYAGLIFARSGLSTKKGLAPANKVGVCDSDYRGEYVVALHNHSNEAVVVDNGERIAQLVVVPFLAVDFVEVESLSETVRGAGGFGSTGE